LGANRFGHDFSSISDELYLQLKKNTPNPGKEGVTQLHGNSKSIKYQRWLSEPIIFSKLSFSQSSALKFPQKSFPFWEELGVYCWYISFCELPNAGKEGRKTVTSPS
jgi:hypothetical protein